MFADRLAKAFNLGKRYAILPFKGTYYKLDPASEIRIKRLIYPVPDMNVPFLGIHFTRMVNGDIYIGPSAMPAMGRENYSGLKGISPLEAPTILFRIARQYVDNQQGFRRFAHEEGLRLIKSNFVKAAKLMVPRLQSRYLLRSNKIGIRAQLVDTVENKLVMDFLFEEGNNSTHILNAVSPAFTSAFSFVKYVLDQKHI